MGLKNLTGLWLSDKGKRGLSVKTKDEIVIPAGSRLFVFKNERKQDDRHPDYHLVIAEDDDGPQQSQGGDIGF